MGSSLAVVTVRLETHPGHFVSLCGQHKHQLHDRHFAAALLLHHLMIWRTSNWLVVEVGYCLADTIGAYNSGELKEKLTAAGIAVESKA